MKKKNESGKWYVVSEKKEKENEKENRQGKEQET